MSFSSAGARGFVGAGAFFAVVAVALGSTRAVAMGPEWAVHLAARASGEVVVAEARTYGLGRGEGLQPGAVVLAVDARDPRAFVGRDLGPVSELTFRDADGSERTARARGVPASLQALLFAEAALFAALGWVVFRWAREPAHRVSTFVFATSFALALAAVPAATLGHAWAALLASVAATVAAPAFATLFLFFPTPLRGARASAAGLLVVAAALAASTVALFIRGTTFPDSLNSVLFAWFGATLLGGFALLVARAIRGPHRDTLAPMGLATLFGVTPLALFTALPRTLGTEPILRGDVAAAGALLIPVVFGYAILRHKLFALDALVRHVVIQASVTLLGVALFTALWLASRVLSFTHDMAAVLSAAAVVWMGPTLWRRTRQLVDTWLYPPMRLARLESGAFDTADVETIGQAACALLRQVVPARWAACVVHEGDGDTSRWRVVGADGERPLVLQVAGGGHSHATIENVDDLCATVPIGRSGLQLGSLLVGPRLDGSALSGIDQAASRTVARSVAAPLEAALLREHAADEARFRDDLLALGRELAAAGSVHDVLRVTAEQAAQLLGAERVTRWRGDSHDRLAMVGGDGNPALAATEDLAALVGAAEAEELSQKGAVRVRVSQDRGGAERRPLLACVLGADEAGGWVCLVQRRPGAAAFTARDERHALEIASHVKGALRRAAERERAEALVERMRRHQELLLTSAGEGIVGFDVDGRVTFANPAATRFTGFEAHELVGQRVHALLYRSRPDGTPARADDFPIYQTLRHGRPLGGSDETLWRKDGQSFPVEYQATPILEGDAVAGAVLTFKDITDRRAAERVKDEFASTVSHELRTPLNGVIGLADLLYATKLDPTQRDYALGVKRAGEALLAIVNDILDFSKIEAGKVVLEDTEVDMRSLVAEVTALLRKQASAKGLELATIVHRTIPSTLRGDPAQLRQVLLNLVGNAVKFTERGEVVVRATAEGELGDAVALRFEVQDTGIGIPPEARERLFHPFSQVDSSTTRKYGGTGLGLAICRRVVEAMGGQIGVESEPGAGSTFWFRVRLRRVETPGVPSSAGGPVHVGAGASVGAGPRRDQTGGAHILLVDDSPIGQQVARGMLEHLGHTADVAENGREAVEACARREYDAILMDCRMPVLDGFEATALIRAREGPGRRKPIIAMTAGVQASDRERCLAVGMDDYVAKPVRLERLAAVLERWLAPSAGSKPGDPLPVGGGAGRPAAPNARGGRSLEAMRAGAVAVYRSELPGCVAELQAAAEAGDTARVRALAHRLAGDSALVGEARLETLARRVEERAGSAATPELLAALGALEAAAQRRRAA